ncbi:Tyrosine-protein kinase ptk [Rubripirellula lacrimiformis]|uniref:non-specific protein-tyrosine kinase n=1 Tax=Rubripirellula lacrimiformis TaxID=1930273 RepID=A0A517N8M1_9BACT|nr:polysaccharide biosynthesis tyrosine autokinase [Rubripirellula lacrimiformis]QDT03486.1 Tyrosine-protein kinase ptk [Rubripirellula lacrimiformis]
MKATPLPEPRFSDSRLSDPSTAFGSSAQPEQQAINVAAAVWRYRWAVAIPVLIGAVCGLMIYLQLPETYRSTTRLMIESDKSTMLDSMTGEIVGGVPGLDIVESQLFSDRVMEAAFENPKLHPFHKQFENESKAFTSQALRSMELEPEVDDVRTAQSVVALLHFESENRELCQPVVQAFSESLQAFYNENYKSSRGDLIKLISTGMEQLHPKMLELESRYREFRRDAPLAWDSEGKAINPHRERQLFLVGSRSEVVEKLRQKSVEVAAIESIIRESGDDPLLGLSIIGELLDKKFSLPNSQGRLSDLQQGDSQLASNNLAQELVPLMIERDKFEAEFGPSHPSVKVLDAQLSTMRRELQKLVQEKTSRVMELMSETLADPRERAVEAVNAVVLASKAQIDLLKAQIKELDGQITVERQDAAKLAQFEQENQAQLREIERTRDLLNQLEEQMARVTISEDERGTRVIELTAPSLAYKVGPSLLKTVGGGSILGILLGCGLALLLEKNANTFRDPDEIADILGVPVLTHIPFFKGKLKKVAKGETNPYEKFDPSLAVVHMPASIPAEAIRSCRTSVFFELTGQRGKVIQVTSPLPGDGKSTIAGNLACSIAQSGKRTLVIDCDLRRPQLTDNFDMADLSGLSEVLNGECEAMDACRQTPLRNLFVMPSGAIPANPAEALTLPDMQNMIEMLREKFDYVMLDTPPLLVVTDPSITASLVDGVIVALRIRRKSRHNAKESISILRSVGAKILGVVINNSDEAGASDGYRGYGYYRYGRHTSRYYRSGKGDKSSRRRSEPRIISGRGAAIAKVMEQPAQEELLDR